MNEVAHQLHPVCEMQPVYDYSSEEDMLPLRIQRRRGRVASSNSKNLHEKEEESRPLRRLRLHGASLSDRRVKASPVNTRCEAALSDESPSEGKHYRGSCTSGMEEEYIFPEMTIEDYDLEAWDPESDEWFLDDIGWSYDAEGERKSQGDTCLLCSQMHEAKNQHPSVHEMQLDYSLEDDFQPLRIRRRHFASSPSKNLHKKEEDPITVEGELQPLRKLRLRASSSHKRAKDVPGGESKPQKYPYPSAYQNKCTLFTSDRATGDGAEQHEESANAMETEIDRDSTSETSSGGSSKKLKRDRLADVVNYLAESFKEFVSKLQGAPKPSLRDIYDVVSGIVGLSGQQVLKAVKRFISGPTEEFEMLKNLTEEEKLDWILLCINDL